MVNRQEANLPITLTVVARNGWFRFLELNGKRYLVDYFLRWVEVVPLRSTTAATSINHIKSIFSRFSLPDVFISDNGPQYKSS